MLGWKHIGKTMGTRVKILITPGPTVEHSYYWDFHLPVWRWRAVGHWYLAWFGRLYVKETKWANVDS